jgi:L,D-peptidoglycan transpeptidase YkuD (ErfK/YbiS/YcfS/YnhG family)
VLTLALVLALHACPQRIRVIAPSTVSTTASVSLVECGRTVLGPWRAWVGYAGLSARHREGDGTTPIGTFAIGPVAYGVDPDPGLHLAYHRLRCGDWWDEDPSSPAYNTFRHVPCGVEPPFHGSSEALWRSHVAYREFAFVEYNAHPAVPGRGSAIFLHDSLGHPTNGCISLPRPELLQLLRRLQPGATMSISVDA